MLLVGRVLARLRPSASSDAPTKADQTIASEFEKVLELIFFYHMKNKLKSVLHSLRNKSRYNFPITVDKMI